MGDNVKFSIIMSAYNMADNIAESLGCIAAQDYDNFEVIVLDDGSTDRTFNIARSFEEKDDRFIVIKNPEPLGVFASRNIGIERATGDYLLFMDPRDFAKNHWLSVLGHTLSRNPVDVLIYSYAEEWRHYGYSKVISLDSVDYCDDCFSTNDEVILHRLAMQLTGISALGRSSNKAYKKSLLVECEIKFAQVNYLEDVFFNCDVWDHVKSMTLFSDVLYHCRRDHQYRIPADSIIEYYEAQKFAFERIYEQQQSWRTCDFEAMSILATTFFSGIIFIIIDMVMEGFSDERILEWAKKEQQGREFQALHNYLKKGYDRETLMCQLASEGHFETIISVTRSNLK